MAFIIYKIQRSLLIFLTFVFTVNINGQNIQQVIPFDVDHGGTIY